jgi:hypothetical protein
MAATRSPQSGGGSWAGTTNPGTSTPSKGRCLVPCFGNESSVTARNLGIGVALLVWRRCAASARSRSSRFRAAPT